MNEVEHAHRLHARAGTAPPRAAWVLRRPDDAGDPRGAGGGRPGRRGRGLRGRAGLPPGGPAAGPRRLAGAGLADRARRPRWHHAGPAHLHRRGGDRAGAGAVPDHQHGGADDHAVRHPRAAVVLPAADRGRRDPLLDRVLRAGGRHRPGVAAHHGDPGRRPVRDQRAEDVDQPDPVRRLRSGWPAGRGRTGTRACPSSSCPRRPRGSPGRRCARSRA